MTQAIEFGGLFCELNLPLELSSAEAEVAGAFATDLANQNCLKVTLGLDDVVHENMDESAELGVEIQRLDFKVNVILELLAQLVSQNTRLPPAVDLKLGAHMLQWLSGESTAHVGEECQATLYLDPRFPFPLVLAGEVVDITPVDAAWRVTFQLHSQAELTQQLLEKYIFRCHRRHIAKLKSKELGSV